MSEIRPHFRKAVRDGNGNLRTDATVALLTPGSSDPITVLVFTGPTALSTRETTWVTSSGIVDFYLDDPMVVDIKVTPAGGGTPVTFANQWVGDAENLTPDGLTAEGAAAGHSPVADGAGGWAWGPVGGGVTTVNGQPGDVVLTAESIGAVPIGDVASVSVLTRAQFDALVETDPTTLYLILPEA
jgi:hypothetical protein